MKPLYATDLAEQAIQKYTHPAAWAKFVCGVELDPLQLWRWEHLDRHPNTIHWDARGMRKSSTIALHALKDLATRPHGELLNVQPRKAQADKFLAEHMLKLIWRSPILLSFIDRRTGKKKINETSFQFANWSKAWGEGVYARVDGGTITIFIFDEVEDMDIKPLTSNFLPMIGRTERMGASEKIRPQIRVCGVMKGSDIIDLFMSESFFPMTQPDYPNGPIIGNAALGVQMGILNPDTLEIMRQTMHPDDWKRQMECQKVEGDSVIRYSWVRQSMTQVLTIAEPMPGREYPRRGIISIGYDHLGHSESATGSQSALVVAEMIGEFVCFPYVKTWPASADETQHILPDLVSIWRYFKPDVFHGDAYGIGLLTTLNDELYRFGLTHIDRRTINDGQSTASAWQEWAAKPIRFDGMQKHNMVDSMRLLFQRGHVKMPFFDDGDMKEPVISDFYRFSHQLANIVKKPTKTHYPSYKMEKAAVGDDLFDAASAAVWGLVARGLVSDAVILIGHRPALSLGGNVTYIPHMRNI
jgi:hypothetical protein